MSTLAERVRAARDATGMSQPEAAMKAGIGLTALRNIEQGITEDPRLSTIRQLENALDAPLFHAPEGDTPSNGRGEPQTEDNSPTPRSHAITGSGRHRRP